MIRAIHRYAGLAIGVLLAIICVSGSLLVYRASLERALHPERYAVQPTDEHLSAQAWLNVAQRLNDSELPAHLELPRDQNDPLVVYTDADGPHRFERLFVDPYHGSLLARAGPLDDALGWLYQLHVAMLSGEAGHRLVGVLGLSMLVFAATGLWLWWPGIRRVPASLSIPRRPPPRFWSRSHSSPAVVGAPLLVLIALTGSAMVFHDQAAWLLNRATLSAPSPMVPAASTALPGSWQPLDRLLGTARKAIPDARATWIHLPSGLGRPLTVRLKLPAESHRNGRSFVHLDPATGDILATRPNDEAEAGTRAYNALFPYHTGDAGGHPLRAIYAGIGLVPAWLALSGLWVWWRRRRRRIVR